MSGTWTTVDIAGKAADTYDPPDRPRFGLIYLHGVGQETLSDQPKYTNLFAKLRLGCVVPRGGYTWWSDRILREYDPSRTAEQYVRTAVVPYVRQRWALGERSVGLFGISMGGQGALRMAFRHPEEFPVVAAISPAIEYHEYYGQGNSLDEMYESKEQARQDTAILHIHPSRFPPHIFFCCDPDDDWHRGADRLHEKLSALGVPHEYDLTTRAGGHTWDYYNAVADRVIAFLHDGLEQESRRLL
ncbi:MAG TPA: alpha/beta hydrolase-fold protein [Gemmataceae bacterium]|jgi:S-formylglutathione hydrolase|nr:alpha/beta hydrolase-fold protein [Gemmataceae bacterium]